jgi:aspartate kinase
MNLIVQKFGGTSVADCNKILAAARKAIRARQQGNQVVVVVSAMGKNTDELVDLAKQICATPPAREMDMLLSTGEQVSVALMAMAVHSLGYEAVSLTGAQIGIRTDSTHTKARIHSISTERMQALLDEGKIVVAAGFQGIDEGYNITTLGRGGSDTTAVALAAVLRAKECQIYTDVDGVYTTDPRLLPEARKMDRVSYDEMLELASLGAGVMHSRSIEFGKKYGVPIHVRSSFSDVPGTIIGEAPESLDRPVGGATLTSKEARITVRGVPDRPGVSLALFSKIAAGHNSVDMIVQNIGAEGKADISFTVLLDDLPATLSAVSDAARSLGAEEVTHDDQVAKVSVVGLGMARQAGVADTMFRALADAGVNILMITTSEIKISVLVARDQALVALRTVHNVFALHERPAASNPTGGGVPAARATAVDIISRLQSMEGLTVDAVELDESQGLVTISEIPDRPGAAARIFKEIAAAGVFVDMIVQSTAADGIASISFTTPRASLPECQKVARSLVQEFEGLHLATNPEVAKLSVSGIGMKSHAQVAIRMFQSLADRNINVAMINTSEVRVNLVVNGADGRTGLAALEEAFAEARV